VRKQKYLESAKRYEANGKYKEAEIQLNNAMKIDKSFADAHFELAKVDIKDWAR
jgi:Tfp pilus assembly protein PilF